MAKTDAERQSEYRARQRDGLQVVPVEISYDYIATGIDQGLLTDDGSRDPQTLGKFVGDMAIVGIDVLIQRRAIELLEIRKKTVMRDTRTSFERGKIHR